jgi:predicted site-specific integrase-resolvase
MREELINKYLNDIDNLGFDKTLTLTSKQTAQVLNISVRTLENWRKDNNINLPFKNVGKSYIYTKRDVAEFLAKE